MAVVALLALSGGWGGQTASATPERAIQALFRAIYANDVAGYNAITVADPRRARLTSSGRANPDKLRQLEEDPGLLQMKVVRPFLFHGRPATLDARGQYPVSTTVLYRAVTGGQPMVVTLVRRPEGWRVDLRWWLSMTDLMTADPKPGTAEYAAHALVFALLSLDQKEVARHVVPGADMTLVFAGAPRQREPSGHLEALGAEMPLVELGPGEFAALPGDRVVEGSAQPDLKVLIGQYGTVEVPFVVHRVGSEWRADALPYFLWLNR